MHVVGEVFTPFKWAEWIIDRWDIFNRWKNGESVCDPTAGKGVFGEVLIQKSIQLNIKITNKMLNNLHLIDLKEDHLKVFSDRIKDNFGITIPDASLHVCDVIVNPPDLKFDILVGNPPWCNFADLPNEYKDELKPYFIEYELVINKRSALLGASRIDISALIIKSVMLNLLKIGGDTYFYVPLSLFSGSEAHDGFRNYKLKNVDFSVREVYEFVKEDVFNGVGTAYGASYFKRDKVQKFPVTYYKDGIKFKAMPLKRYYDPWRVSKNIKHLDSINVNLKSSQKPRQGVNTCGANFVFIFDFIPDYIDNDYLFPFVTKNVWKDKKPKPVKWVFLPYNNKTGKALTKSEILLIKGYEYLRNNENILKERRGVLINNLIDKGLWWSLLGVGLYSFAPYKVIWEAYGSHKFNPLIVKKYLGKIWQANSSMHAYIPCWNFEDAKRIQEELSNPDISKILIELNGQGKCNFAQPGKIKKILGL